MKRKQLEQCAWEQTPASQRRDKVELTTMRGTTTKKLTGNSREVIVFDPSGDTPGTMEPFVPLWSLYNDELQQRCLFGKIPRLHSPYHRTRPDYTSSIEGDPQPPGSIGGARKKKSSKQLDREVAQALAGRSSDTGSAFYDFLLERFPSGDVPWPWVEKILKGHGTSMPLMIGLGKEDAEQYGIRQGKPADVHQLARFLGY